MLSDRRRVGAERPLFMRICGGAVKITQHKWSVNILHGSPIHGRDAVVPATHAGALHGSRDSARGRLWTRHSYGDQIMRPTNLALRLKAFLGEYLPIQKKLSVPVLYVGLGEDNEDIDSFDHHLFISALIGEHVPP